jgi:hypothetical protein
MRAIDPFGLVAAGGAAASGPGPGVETTTYRVRAVLVEMKIEEDGDVHLVIAQPGATKLTMIVEFPTYACTRGAVASARTAMRSARTALVKACGTPSARGRDCRALLSGLFTCGFAPPTTIASNLCQRSLTEEPTPGS